MLPISLHYLSRQFSVTVIAINLVKRLRNLLLLAIGVYLLTGIAQIRPEERAVVRRFGQVVAKPGPGLWIGFPYGIDRIDRVPTATVRRVPVGFRPDNPDDAS